MTAMTGYITITRRAKKALFLTRRHSRDSLLEFNYFPFVLSNPLVLYVWNIPVKSQYKLKLLLNMTLHWQRWLPGRRQLFAPPNNVPGKVHDDHIISGTASPVIGAHVPPLSLRTSMPSQPVVGNSDF